MGNYRGNIESLMHSDFAIYQREDNSKRVNKIARDFGKSGNWPTLDTLQNRYSINEFEAKKLLASAKRHLAKLRRKELAVEAARAERRAMLESITSLPPTSTTEQPLPDIDASQPASTTQQLEVSASVLLDEILTGIRDKYGEEIRKHGEQTVIPEGFVYLVTHELFTGWVKAGMTIDYEFRLSIYNVSDPLSRFRFAALKWVPNRRQAERLLLDHLASAATTRSGEWFMLPIETAKTVFDAHNA